MCEKKEFEKHLTQEDIASFHAMTLDTDALIAFAGAHRSVSRLCGKSSRVGTGNGYTCAERLCAGGAPARCGRRQAGVLPLQPAGLCRCVRFSDAVVYREFFL